MYFNLVLYLFLYCFANSFSVMLLGDRKLISGNLLSIDKALELLFHWKFILSMTLAIGARFTFIMINNSLTQIPHLAKNSTTITTFVASISYISIIVVNYFFLDESLSTQQLIGAALIMGGISLMLK